MKKKTQFINQKMPRIQVSRGELRKRAEQMIRWPTKSEREMYKILFHLYGNEVTCQVVLRPYIVDFLIKSRRLVIEVDGDSHEGREDYDKQRDERIAKRFKFRIFRVRARDLFEDASRERVIQEIEELVRNTPKEVFSERQIRQRAKSKRRKARKQLGRLVGVEPLRKKPVRSPLPPMTPAMRKQVEAFEERKKLEAERAEKEKREKFERLYSRTI